MGSSVSRTFRRRDLRGRFNGVSGTVKGLFYGDGSQFGAQIVGVITCFVFVFVLTFVFLKVTNMVVPMRVAEEVELEGLDQSEVAVTAYPDFNLAKTHR